MELERDIEEIRTAIKIGGFANEAAVSQCPSGDFMSRMNRLSGAPS